MKWGTPFQTNRRPFFRAKHGLIKKLIVLHSRFGAGGPSHMHCSWHQNAMKLLDQVLPMIHPEVSMPLIPSLDSWESCTLSLLLCSLFTLHQFQSWSYTPGLFLLPLHIDAWDKRKQPDTPYIAKSVLVSYVVHVRWRPRPLHEYG